MHHKIIIIMNKNLEHQTLHLRNVPIDCRINILSYLSPTDLYANYAHCSRSCHTDSLSSELPQTKWGEFHVGNSIDTGELSEQMGISMESLLQRISHASFQSAWQAPRCHIKKLLAKQSKQNL